MAKSQGFRIQDSRILGLEVRRGASGGSWRQATVGAPPDSDGPEVRVHYCIMYGLASRVHGLQGLGCRVRRV